MSSITLTNDQEAAFNAITAFLVSPSKKFFVLSGYAGTGKTTLVNHMLNNMDNIIKTAKLLNPKTANMELLLTATTHKAAAALSSATSAEVITIHSALGLIVETNYKDNTTKLVVRSDKQADFIKDTILLIDESSYIDNKLLSAIQKRTIDCKVIYIGDPAQLLNVGCAYSPVFNAGLPEATLKEVVRQAKGNPIIELASEFRGVLDTGKFFSFKPDGNHIRHVSTEDFQALIKASFSSPGHKPDTSKILAWTNKRVIAYNEFVCNALRGTSEFAAGDNAISNSYVAATKGSVKSEQDVVISTINPTTKYSVDGYDLTLVGYTKTFFMPKVWQTPNNYRKQIIKWAGNRAYNGFIKEFSESRIDLRHTHACTINKSQGSTYDNVFIDLDDLKKCNSGNQLARLLYVAVSRARNHVILTGDLV
jgi:ATP-dependent exoDNAse (exonuclease V) alpha subunit